MDKLRDIADLSTENGEACTRFCWGSGTQMDRTADRPPSLRNAIAVNLGG